MGLYLEEIMADNKMPWEMNWNGQQSNPQPQPVEQPTTQTTQQPWEMDWGNKGSSTGNEGTSWGIYNSEDGSILNTAGAGINRQSQNFLAALVYDPETSRYQLRKAQQANKDYQSESSKLGLAGNVVAGALTYAPTIAAGAVNPLLGAGMMGAATTAESLAAQQENNRPYDVGDATLAGVGSATLDLGTMGLAGRATNIARSLSTPVRRVAGELGSQGAQAATSNAGSQAMINLASGRDWTEGLGEAALIGGVTGAGVHGGLRGLNNVLGLKTTPEADRSINDVRDLSVEAGFRPTEDFTRSVHDYSTLTSSLKRDISNSNLEESRTNVDALVNAGVYNPEGNIVALKDAAKIAKDFGMPVTSNFFNFDVNGQNAATGYLGLDPKQVTRDGQNIQHATPSLFNRSRSQTAGETRESWRRDFKKGYDEALNTFQGNAESNVLSINTMLDSGSSRASGMRPQLMDLRDTLSNYQKLVSDATERGRMPSDDVLSHYSKKIYNLGNETGTLGELVNPLTGKAGDFDPVTNLKTIKMFHDGSVSNYPQVRHGLPNVDAEKGGNFQPTILDAAGFVAGTPWITAARVAKGVLGARASQRHLRNTKERGSDIVDSLAREPSGFRNQAATEGDFAAGAHEAAADLNSMGLNTGGAERSVPISDSLPSVTPESTVRAPAVDEPSVVRDPVVTDLPLRDDSPVPLTERTPVNPDGFTGRSIRDRETELALQRAEAERQANVPPVVDEGVVASQRASRGALLSEQARVDNSRRTPAQQVLEETGGVPEVVRDVDPSEVSHREVNEDGSATDVTNSGERVLVIKGNEDKTLNAAAARRNRLSQEASESVPLAEPVVTPRGNSDSTLTRDAARMEANRTEPVVQEDVPPVIEDVPDVAPEVVPRGNSDSRLTQDAARMEAARNRPQEQVQETVDATPTERTTSDPEPVTEPSEAPDDIVSTKSEPKVKASELVRKPVKDLEDRVEKMTNSERNKNPGLISKVYQQRDLLKRVDNSIDDYIADGRTSSEEVWGMINRQGGLDSFTDPNTVKSRLTALIRKDRDESAKQAEEDARAATEAVDDVVNKSVGKNLDEVLAKMRKDFQSKGISGDVFDEARTRTSDMFKGEYSPEHVANQVREIMKARAKEARKTADTAKKEEPKPIKEKPITRTLQDSYTDVKDYAEGLGVWSEKEVRNKINSVTNSGNKDRKTRKPLSEGAERNLYNHIDDFIKGQIESYEKALSAPNVTQNVEYANWRRKLSTLVKNRENIKSQSDWESAKVAQREKDAKERISREESRKKSLDKKVEEAEKSAREAEDAVKSVDNASKDFENEVNDTVSRASQEIEKSLADVSDFRIQNAALESTGNIPDYITSKFDPDFLKYKAKMNAAVSALSSRGLGKEARAIKTSVDALEKALSVKEVLPNNPEYWLSNTDIKRVKDALNGGPRGNSWYGDLYQRLRVAVYGTDKELPQTFSEKVIDQKVKSALKRNEAGDVSEGGINAAGIK